MDRRHLPRESRPGSSPGLPRARPARLEGRNSERLGPRPGKAPAWSPCSPPPQRERERQTLQGWSLPPPERSRFAREPSRHLSGRLFLPPGRTESWSLPSARNGHVCASGTVAVAAAQRCPGPRKGFGGPGASHRLGERDPPAASKGGQAQRLGRTPLPQATSLPLLQGSPRPVSPAAPGA